MYKLQHDAANSHLNALTLQWQQSNYFSYKNKQEVKHLSTQWEKISCVIKSHFSDHHCFFFFLIFKLKDLCYLLIHCHISENTSIEGQKLISSWYLQLLSELYPPDQEFE